MTQGPEDLDGWPTAEDLEREWPTEEETAAGLTRWAAEGEAELAALAAVSETDLLAMLDAPAPRPRRRGSRTR